MYLVTGKLRLTALLAAFIGVSLIFGSTFAPREPTDVLADGPLVNNLTCADVYFDPNLGALPSANFGLPPLPTALLTAKALTRSEVGGEPPAVLISTQALYLGEDIPGYEPPQTPYDFALGEIIPDVPPTNMPCVDLAALGHTPPEGTPPGSKTIEANSAAEPIDQLKVKASAVSNIRVADYTVVTEEVAPGVNLSESCVFSGAFGWIKYETYTPAVGVKGPKAVNYGETAIILGTDSPASATDTNGDTKPDVAADPAECTGGTPMTSSFVAINRNPTTDDPANVKDNVILDPDGISGSPVPLPQPPDGDTLADDWDGDGCTDWDELSPSFKAGRDPFNPEDCEPNPAGVHNVLATVQAATKDPGTGEIIPGTYFHCITDISKGVDLGGGIYEITAAAQCYQDSPGLSGLSDTPPAGGLRDDPDHGPDGVSGPPPPPPYVGSPPSLGVGTWDSNTNALQVNICFVDQGGAVMGPNIIADVTVDTVTTKGTVDN